jgi:hypothetical protein
MVQRCSDIPQHPQTLAYTSPLTLYSTAAKEILSKGFVRLNYHFE